MRRFDYRSSVIISQLYTDTFHPREMLPTRKYPKHVYNMCIENYKIVHSLAESPFIVLQLTKIPIEYNKYHTMESGILLAGF